MSYDSDKHHRRYVRLKGHDYAQPGAYFVTICTRERESLFGYVVNGEMLLNEAGETARRCWEDIPDHFPLVELDAFVIMPNHVHGIIVITEPCRGEKSFAPIDAPTTTSGTTPQSPSRTIGSMVRGSEIVIPCKGEASVPPHSSEEQRGSDASPLRQPPNGTQPGSLSAIVQNFKSVSTRRMNAACGAPGRPLWLRNYYEHIVRDEAELTAIREYIQGNPARWDDDENNPLRLPAGQ
jgi:REP element-mobilizing transposase RayT